MSIGKEIKVVLALDDAGFSVKTKAAADTVQTLKVGLGELSKSNTQVESSIADLTKHIKGFSDGFGGLQKSLEATVASLNNSVKNSFAQMNATAKDSAKVAKDSATQQIDAKIKTLNAELDTNKRMLEARGRMHAELRKLESDQRAQSTAAMMNAEKADRGKKAGAQGVISANLNEADRLERNANAIRKEIAATEAWIASERQAQAARVSEIASLEADRKTTLAAAQAKETLARVSAAVGKSNAAEIQRVTRIATAAQKDADAAAIKSADEHARYKKRLVEQEVRDRREAEAQIRREVEQTAALQRREAQETAAAQRREAQQVAQMWRGMAAAYTGAKVEKGLGAAVNQADQLERQKVLVSALNLGDKEEGQLFASADAMSKNLKFLSTLEAIQSRMSAIASIGYNNVDVIDKTLTTAVKAANNLQSLGLAHGDTQSTIRNLYGVVEMRQQTHDTDATNRTFEVMQKIITGTAGKVQTQDMETVLRRLGMGASQLSDKGLINLAAVVDQFKVAGGDGGGSGGGVSTVGTAFKMMQSYALGKGLSNTAVKEFAGAGVLADSGIDMSQDSAGVLRDAKHGGFKDADLWLKDPVAAVQKIMPQIVAYTQSDKQRQKYYQGRDTSDAENQMVAVSMYLARLGITTTASQALMVAGDPRSKERIGHQAETIEGSKGINAVDAKLAETYNRDVQEVTTSLKEIGQIVGTTLLPPLKAVLGVIKEFLVAARDFAQNNPLATQVTAIAAAFGGAYLSVRGFMMLFGSGGLGGVITSFLGLAGRIAPALAAPVLTGGGAWMGVKALFVELGEWIGALILRIPLVGTALLKLGSAFGVAGGFLKGFGAIFRGLTMVLLAWDFGQIIGTWLKDVKLGTITIGEQFQNMFLNIELGYKRLMLATEEKALGARNFFHIDSDDEYKKGLARIADQRAALAVYEKQMRIEAPAALPAPAKKDDKSPEALARKKQLADADKALKDRKSVNNPDANQKIIDAANGAGKREDRDPLNAALANAEGKVKAQQEKLNALVAGGETVESLRKQAAELIEGKRLADEFSANHLASNRPGANSDEIKRLKEKTFQEMLLAEQIKGITFANERTVATTYEADQAMERIANGGAAKQTDAFRALARELERAEERLGAGAAGFDKWASAKNKALFNQAVADSTNFAAGYVEKNQADAGKLLPTEKARIEAELAANREKEDKLHRMHVDTLEKNRAAAVATAETLGEVGEINLKALKARDLLEEQYSARRKIRAEEEARAMESATAKMTRDWKDVGKAVDDIGANAASGFVSMLTGSLDSGRLAVGDFVKGVLMDIANAKLKQALADPLKDAVNAGGSWLKTNLFGVSGDAGAGAAAATRATADTAAATATTMMTTAVGQATLALQTMASSAGMSSGMDIAGSVGGFFGGSAASGAVENFLFADGGIMTSMGPMELRKYANGGVANSPQVAIYGEAGPEAYVPLPDGRSIPVTMSGGQQGAAPSVQVNVINQTGQPANAQQGGIRFDGKQYILDVVMTAASTPGSFRQNMKDAMK